MGNAEKQGERKRKRKRVCIVNKSWLLAKRTLSRSLFTSFINIHFRGRKSSRKGAGGRAGTAEGEREKSRGDGGYLVEGVTRNRAGHKSPGFRRRSRLRITHYEKPSSLSEIVIRYSSPSLATLRPPTIPNGVWAASIFALLLPISITRRRHRKFQRTVHF